MSGDCWSLGDAWYRMITRKMARKQLQCEKIRGCGKGTYMNHIWRTWLRHGLPTASISTVPQHLLQGPTESFLNSEDVFAESAPRVSSQHPRQILSSDVATGQDSLWPTSPTPNWLVISGGKVRRRWLKHVLFGLLTLSLIPRNVAHGRRSRNLSRYVVLVGEVFKFTAYFGRINLLAWVLSDSSCTTSDLRLNVCAASSMAANAFVGDTGCCGWW